MKKLLIAFIFLISMTSNIRAIDDYTCGHVCAESADCVYWVVQYCVDCNGLIEQFVSIHKYKDGTFVISTHEDTPEWIGLNRNC